MKKLLTILIISSLTLIPSVDASTYKVIRIFSEDGTHQDYPYINKGTRTTWGIRDARDEISAFDIRLGKPENQLIRYLTVEKLEAYDFITPFSKDSWAYQPASLLSVTPDSQALVSEVVKQSKPTSNGGSAIYGPGIIYQKYSTPIYHITQDTSEQSIVVKPGAWNEFTIQIRGPDNLVAGNESDGHAVIFDHISKKYAEFWRLNVDTKTADWGAEINDFPNSNGLIPSPYGARASGIATSLGVIRLKSLENGVIPHAIVGALVATKNDAIYPANRWDSFATSSGVIKMGQRFRLPSDYVIPDHFPPILKMICQAIKDYGWFIADTTNGNNINLAYIEQANEDLSKYTNGEPWWKIASMFPFSKLEAVQ